MKFHSSQASSFIKKETPTQKIYSVIPDILQDSYF